MVDLRALGTEESVVTEEKTRERAGLFLLTTKFTFKLSPFATHPHVMRPFHSISYLYPLQDPGGWVGSFP